jgi:hypothetical protein
MTTPDQQAALAQFRRAVDAAKVIVSSLVTDIPESERVQYASELEGVYKSVRQRLTGESNE